jgi:hypothetical protein
MGWSDTGELEFTADLNVNEPDLVLDGIAFSPQAIPEPCPVALRGVGALLLALYPRIAPKRP